MTVWFTWLCNVLLGIYGGHWYYEWQWVKEKQNFDYLIKSTIMLKLYDIEILKLEYNMIL